MVMENVITFGAFSISSGLLIHEGLEKFFHKVNDAFLSVLGGACL
jgi:hypothetical protein